MLRMVPMPRFEPFAGVRYDRTAVDMNAVIAPPYDVIGEEEHARLEARSPYNSVRLELPRDEVDRNRYESARCLFEEWQAAGVLVADDAPSFYAYRMTFTDEAGRARATTGVLGAMALSDGPTGDVLPHERTMPKPKGDRLDLLRACQTNLSPIWGLSLASGLTATIPIDGEPTVRVTDDEGTTHELWRIIDSDAEAAIRDAVGSAPVVVADGHHRLETARAYRDEQPAGAAGVDAILTYVVELVDDELSVRAIHRLLTGLPAELDLPGALSEHFEVEPVADADDTITLRMQEAGALALITPTGTWLLRPTAATAAAAEHDLDSSRLDVARAALPAHEVSYQHGWDLAAGAVRSGAADAAVLLRPATVAQIAATGHQRVLMPEKTTFFFPKPRTGLVFRRLDG